MHSGVGGNSCLKMAEGDWPQMWNVGCQFYRIGMVVPIECKVRGFLPERQGVVTAYLKVATH